MTAAATQARDPQRIARLVAELTNPSDDVRHAAAVDLAAAGQDGVNAALDALANETDPQRTYGDRSWPSRTHGSPRRRAR